MNIHQLMTMLTVMIVRLVIKYIVICIRYNYLIINNNNKDGNYLYDQLIK